MGKIELNETLIFYIGTLKNEGIITTWSEGAKIYFDIEKKEITPSLLSSRFKSINFTTSVNPQLFFEYCKYTPKLKKKEEIHEEVVDSDTPLTRTLSIPKSDYKDIFNVDLTDSPEEIRRKVLEKINNEAFLLNYLGFDPSNFEIKKVVMGGWSTPVKTKNSDGTDELNKVLNDKFTVVIGRRKKPILFYSKEECDKFLSDFLKQRKLTPFDLFNKEEKSSLDLDKDLLMVSPGLELHLGKLASIVDSEDYSTKQAMYRIKKVVEEMVDYQRRIKASNLILGVGNDFFNSDTVDDKTTAGTPQNNDTRFKEVYLWGKVGYIRMIETLKREFDKVILKGNPGNHDEKSSFSLFTNLYDLYNLTDDPKVEVSFGYQDLRYTTCYSFGDNLIVFSHGKNPEGKNLSDKVIAEAVKYQYPDEYNKAKNVYVFVGHLHQDSETKFDKVTVLRTASLTGIDSWHYGNCYLGQRQGHSVYLIDKKRGYVGKRNITLTEEEKEEKIDGIPRTHVDDVYSEMTSALDLNSASVVKGMHKKRVKEIDKELKTIDDKYDALIDEIFEVLKISGNLNKETIDELKIRLGYDKETSRLISERVKIKMLEKKS